MTNEKLRLANRIQERLNGIAGGAVKPRVLADELWLGGEGEWKLWYVPVSVHRDEVYMDQVYNAFSEIEEAFEAEGIEILLVPRLIARRDLQDSA